MIEDLVQLETLVEQYTQVYSDQVDDRMLQCVSKEAAPAEVRTQIEFMEYSSAATLADASKHGMQHDMIPRPAEIHNRPKHHHGGTMTTWISATRVARGQG